MVETLGAKFVILIVLLISVIVHELSHGAVADANGDPTPRLAGRLTWNPLAHLDPLGTLFMVIIVFTSVPFIGWAKPVPINPTYFRNYRKGMIATALAGPFANYSLMLLCMGILYFMFVAGVPAGGAFGFFLGIGMLINFVLMFFNLIPIPPLDGSRVLAQFLPWRHQMSFNRLESYGFIILIALVFTGVFGIILNVAFFGFDWVTTLLFGNDFTTYLMQAARLS